MGPFPYNISYPFVDKGLLLLNRWTSFFVFLHTIWYNDFMQFFRNLKHIFFITLITLFFIGILSRIPDFFTAATHFFIYKDTYLQNSVYQLQFKPSPDIAIVRIDEDSINAIQAKGNQKFLSIPKYEYVKLIERLEKAGVKAIGFDIIFENRDSNEELFKSTLENGNIVIAAESNDGDASNCITDEAIGTNKIYTNCSGVPRSIYKDVTWGIASVGKDMDRRVWKIDISDKPYSSWKSEHIIDTLPLALYKKIGGVEPPRYGVGQIVLNPFFGKPGSYTGMSLLQVAMASESDLIAAFSGKVVLVGESGTLIHDEVTSPVSDTKMDGVEIHAHMLDGLLQHRIPHEFNLRFTIALTIGIILVMAFLFLEMPAILTPFTVFIGFYLTIFVGRWLYGSHGIVLNIFPILSASVLTYLITFTYKFFIVDREKRFIQSAFSHYIDPVIVKKISDSDHPVELGGEKKEVTVFFSDIAGFTTISEKMETKELFRLMSNYLSTMTDILINNQGTLDKYIGDAIMGFFWAPLPVPDHTIKACRASLEMRARLSSFNGNLLKSGVDPIDFRIGIASGEVMIGNIGSIDRFNYTALGDTVNLASRLEWAGKEYLTHITVSETVYTGAKDHFLFRKLDRLRVKGKNEPITIYELVSEKDTICATLTDEDRYSMNPNRFLETADKKPISVTADVKQETDPKKIKLDTCFLKPAFLLYEQALELYFQGHYLEAGKLFESNSHIDPPSSMMTQRCLTLIRDKRVLEDGVWEMTTK